MSYFPYVSCILQIQMQNIFGQDTKIIRGWGILVKYFVLMFSSCFMLYPTFIETYKTHKEYMTRSCKVFKSLVDGSIITVCSFDTNVATTL